MCNRAAKRQLSICTSLSRIASSCLYLREEMYVQLSDEDLPWGDKRRKSKVTFCTVFCCAVWAARVKSMRENWPSSFFMKQLQSHHRTLNERSWGNKVKSMGLKTWKRFFGVIFIKFSEIFEEIFDFLMHDFF